MWGGGAPALPCLPFLSPSKGTGTCHISQGCWDAVATLCPDHAKDVLCPEPSLVPSPLSPHLPLLLLAGCKLRCAGGEGLLATHDCPVPARELWLGLDQRFFHEEIALGALDHGKMVHTVFNNLRNGSTAS